MISNRNTDAPNKLNNNECLIINEASSSQTAFFSYDANHIVNYFGNEPKLSIPIKMIDFAAREDAQSYYELLLQNTLQHMINSSCNIFYWSILATGGMRDFEVNYGADLVTSFYNNLTNIFTANPLICDLFNLADCTKIILLEAKTIHGEDEGHFAFLTIAQHSSGNLHSVIDLGGQTAQITNHSHSYSGYLGKERAISNLGKETVVCYNQQAQYNGEACRQSIKTYINQFTNELPQLSAINGDIYVVSNFYHYFNDLCKLYLPYLIDNNSSSSNFILKKEIQAICSYKQTTKEPLVITVGHYLNITDEICHYWGGWEGKLAAYAIDTCFTGNYNYEFLKALGMNNNQQLHVDDSDWALGALISHYT